MIIFKILHRIYVCFLSDKFCLVFRPTFVHFNYVLLYFNSGPAHSQPHLFIPARGGAGAFAH